MDSGNSGNLQSSSGEEEYDSRADSISAAGLMTTTHHHHPAAAAHHHIGSISNNPQQPPPPTTTTTPPLNTTNTSSIFDPLSNYFDTISRPPQNPNSSLLNLDMPWSKTLRSYSNSTEFNSHPMMVSASSIHQSLFGSNQQLGSVSIPPAVTEDTSATNTPRQAPLQPDQNNPPYLGVRNPKKRSRASRRAPTTVLTTDTTNFRAMVQEFTGIPAPPFTSSSPFLRARLELYGTSSPTMRSNNPLDSPQQTPYLRRPFPQKVQLPPPFFASSSLSSSSSLVDRAAIASPTTTNKNISTSTNTYQLPPQSANLFNFPNPILTSLLQSNNVKYQPTNCSIIGSKTPQGIEEIGLSQGQVNTSSLSGLSGLISSDQNTSRNDNNNPVNWGSSTGIGSNDGGDQGHQDRSGNGNFSLSRINNAAAANGKLNYSGSSSNFHGDKGSSDNAVAVAPHTRGEGMMESWICSLD